MSLFACVCLTCCQERKSAAAPDVLAKIEQQKVSVPSCDVLQICLRGVVVSLFFFPRPHVANMHFNWEWRCADAGVYPVSAPRNCVSSRHQDLIRSMEEETVKLSRHLEDHDALKQEYDDLRKKLIEVGDLQPALGYSARPCGRSLVGTIGTRRLSASEPLFWCCCRLHCFCV